MPGKLFLVSRIAVAALAFLGLGCGGAGETAAGRTKAVPRQGRWGIYKLNLATQDVSLIYSSSNTISSSSLRSNSSDTTLLFAEKLGGAGDNDFEICTVGTDGRNFKRLTSNGFMDVYPAWSPDDRQIAFLSLRQPHLHIYVMNADGSNEGLLYASDSHDADIDWVGNSIVFTYRSQIWRMRSDGTSPARLTNPPGAGQQGNANLPFGDYDPRLSPDGSKVVFERLEGDGSVHGNYNLHRVNADGSGEVALTSTAYTQGFPSWSHSGDEIVYLVSAIGDQGKYDLYLMNADGTGNRSVTPDYFPPEFLCHVAIFAKGDSDLYFVGEWYQ